MIAVVQSSQGYTLANNGKVFVRLSDAETEELRTALNETFKPVSTGAVTPAKARLRPPIMRYPVKANR